jgi:hypothetical protein
VGATIAPTVKTSSRDPRFRTRRARGRLLHRNIDELLELANELHSKGVIVRPASDDL